MKIYLLSGIENFVSRGYIFCNINHITIDIVSDKCNMTYEYYINRPMQAIELKLNMIIAKNPQLINSLDRTKITSTYKNIFSYNHLITNKCTYQILQMIMIISQTVIVQTVKI